MTFKKYLSMSCQYPLSCLRFMKRPIKDIMSDDYSHYRDQNEDNLLQVEYDKDNYNEHLSMSD